MVIDCSGKGLIQWLQMAEHYHSWLMMGCNQRQWGFKSCKASKQSRTHHEITIKWNIGHYKNTSSHHQPFWLTLGCSCWQLPAALLVLCRGPLSSHASSWALLCGLRCWKRSPVQRLSHTNCSATPAHYRAWLRQAVLRVPHTCKLSPAARIRSTSWCTRPSGSVPSPCCRGLWWRGSGLLGIELVPSASTVLASLVWSKWYAS